MDRLLNWSRRHFGFPYFKKGRIVRIGTIEDDGTLRGWSFSGAKIGVEIGGTSINKYSGYTIEELRKIIQSKA